MIRLDWIGYFSGFSGSNNDDIKKKWFGNDDNSSLINQSISIYNADKIRIDQNEFFISRKNEKSHVIWFFL